MVEEHDPKEGFFTAHPDQLKTTADQLAQIMGTTADDLNALGTSANAAVAGLLNVPTGFKLAAETFKATLDLEGDAAIKAFRGPILDPGTFPGGDRGILNFRTATAPAIGTQQNIVTVTFAEGAIQQRAGESSVQLAERVVSALRDRARAQMGDTLSFSLE